MSDSSKPEHVKIAFEVEDDDDPECIEVETLWAIPREDGYEIDNIPFFAYSVACGDVVRATPDESGHLVFADVVRPSGNSCVRLIFSDPARVEAVRRDLRGRGCDSELNGSSLVAVNVPGPCDYGGLLTYLEDLEAAGIADYEEACIAHEPLS